MAAESLPTATPEPLGIQDVQTLEKAAEALARAGQIDHAIALWSLCLKMRFTLGLSAEIEVHGDDVT